MHQLSGSDDGFNLLELMAVLTIMGIILAIAIASYMVSSSRAGRIACGQNRRQFDEATQLYSYEHAGQPTTMGDLAAYVKNFDRARRCPSNPSIQLVLDAGTHDVTCPTHGD